MSELPHEFTKPRVTEVPGSLEPTTKDTFIAYDNALAWVTRLVQQDATQPEIGDEEKD